MCGIVGYIGKRSAAPVVLAGLEVLEYRGYDSAGLALIEGDRGILAKGLNVDCPRNPAKSVTVE